MTPQTDKNLDGIFARAALRGFYMPEDVEDLSALARELEQNLAECSAALATHVEVTNSAWKRADEQKSRADSLQAELFDLKLAKHQLDVLLSASIKKAEAQRDELLKALKAAKGYMLNAKIDLATGAPKKTAIDTIEGGLRLVDDAIANVEATSDSASNVATEQVNQGSVNKTNG